MFATICKVSFGSPEMKTTIPWGSHWLFPCFVHKPWPGRCSLPLDNPEILRAGACGRTRRQKIADHAHGNARALLCHSFGSGIDDGFNIDTELSDTIFKLRGAFQSAVRHCREIQYFLFAPRYALLNWPPVSAPSRCGIILRAADIPPARSIDRRCRRDRERPSHPYDPGSALRGRVRTRTYAHAACRHVRAHRPMKKPAANFSATGF